MPSRVTLLVLLAATVAGCGEDDGGRGELTVYAAASLRDALPTLAPGARHSFGGSGRLRLQIERGAPADVFASAARDDARALFEQGRCRRPRTFASNRLALLIPRDNPAGIRSVAGLADRRDLRLAVGGRGAPVGDYTRRALRRLELGALLQSGQVSQEASAAGITAKVATGTADAGFAYVTDARAAGGRVRVLELPPEARPRIIYAACVVRRGGPAEQQAARYVERLAGREGRAVLRRHGFGAP